MSGCFARVGGVYAVLHAGHTVGDYWVQSDHQAVCKGGSGWEARRACAAHVAALTATQAVFLTAAVLTTGERLKARRVMADLMVNAATHYWADRRAPLKRLARSVGKGRLYSLGHAPASGANLLDQAWHTGWLAVAALLIAGRTR